MERLATIIGRTTVLLGGSALVLMMTQIGLDVAYRAIVGRSITGTVEIVSHYHMVAVSFLPIAYAELHGRHIEATVLVDILHKRIKAALGVLARLLSLIIYGLLAWTTLWEALKQTGIQAVAESGTMRISIWVSYWILPVSFALMCLALLARLFFSPREIEARPGEDEGEEWTP